MLFAVASLAAASVFAASAFNYADLAPRTVLATIVADNNAYLSVASYDAEYACYVAYTNGKIDVTWDSGTSCVAGATGTGVNGDAVYYFHDVLVITNKGTKTLTNLWLNMSTDAKISIAVAETAGTITTDSTYAQTKTITTNLDPGDTWYVGFKIDTSSMSTSDTSISRTLSIEARSTT